LKVLPAIGACHVILPRHRVSVSLRRTKRAAAEVIAERADASKLNTGLTTWKGAPGAPIHRPDVEVAKKTSARKSFGP
jgi:hypothetical protein